MPRQVSAKKKEGDWRPKFFEVVRKFGNVRAACREAGISSARVYNLRDPNHSEFDPEFKRKWDEAKTEAIEKMEAEGWRRAVEGCQRGVYYKGGRVDSIREYSDTLLIFMLKAHKPDKYRETIKQEVEAHVTHHDSRESVLNRVSGIEARLGKGSHN